MTNMLLNEGIYDAREVAHLVGVRRVEQVVRWSTADSKHRPAAVPPSFEQAFSFVDLVSMALVTQLRDRGVPDIAVRVGIVHLRHANRVERPLAHRHIVERLGTSGRTFIHLADSGWEDLGRDRQGVFREIAELYLKELSYDASGVANAWKPAAHVIRVRLDRSTLAPTPSP